MVKCRTLVFLLGFFGLLLSFLWFFARYLDKKRLTGPAVMFTLAFFVFLGGNLLLISHAGKNGASGVRTVTVQMAAGAEKADKPDAQSAPAEPDAAQNAEPAGEAGAQEIAADGADVPADGQSEPEADAPALPDTPDTADTGDGTNV